MNTLAEINFLLDEVGRFDYFFGILSCGSAVAWTCLFPTYLIWGNRAVVRWLRRRSAPSSPCLVRDGYGLHLGPDEAIEQALRDPGVRRDTSGRSCVSPDPCSGRAPARCGFFSIVWMRMVEGRQGWCLHRVCGWIAVTHHS
jgi:hypothetical protein